MKNLIDLTASVVSQSGLKLFYHILAKLELLVETCLYV